MVKIVAPKPTNMKKQLTVLSFGGGQDSTYILYRIISDPVYRLEFVKDDFIVVMSDTGNEHDETYTHVKFIKELCLSYNIDFFFLTSAQGYHPNTWPDLITQLRKNSTIMSLMFPRSCTDNIKIKPFYNFLNVYIANKYYDQKLPSRTRNKKWIKQFAAENGKINVLLGFAKGEEKRVQISKPKLRARQLDCFRKSKYKPVVWIEKSILKSYPMIVEGIDRAKAQEYILKTPWPLPPPSLCKICPYKGLPEILYMYRYMPDDFAIWVDLESAKIKKSSHRKVNLGVKGVKLLPEIVTDAIALYGHWTYNQLLSYKMSHGHCVLSKY